jgi:uncharacterized protein YndB with AHSA1/START domain
MKAVAGTPGTESGTDLEISVTRFLDAPRDMVFRMMISPLLIPAWWGPPGRRTEVDYMDVVPGGEWRFVQEDDEEAEYGFHGMYEEVDFPSRLTYSLEYEGQFGENRTETWTLADGGRQAGESRTELAMTAVFESRLARKAAMDAGLLEDLASSMDRLAELLGERPEKPDGSQ